MERVAGFLDELRQERDGERVLVIGHSATRLALEVVANGRELDEHPATIRGDGRTVGSFVRLTGRPTKARGTPPRREPQDGDRTGSGRGV